VKRWDSRVDRGVMVRGEGRMEEGVIFVFWQLFRAIF
jgi:hypothetical protein